MDDKRLVAGLQRGDEKAFAEMVVRYQTPIFNLCSRLLGNRAEAEDVAQDTFVRAIQGIASFRGEAQLGTWLRRIAVNLYRSRLRARAYRPLLDDPDDPAIEVRLSREDSGGNVGQRPPAPDQALDAATTRARIQETLMRLEPAFREILVLRDIEDLEYAEIASLLDLAEGTVKSRLHRARASFQVIYKRLGGER